MCILPSLNHFFILVHICLIFYGRQASFYNKFCFNYFGIFLFKNNDQDFLAHYLYFP